MVNMKLIQKLKHNWQDKVFTIGGLFFSIGLLPTVFNPSAVVPLTTSVPTALFLVAFALTQLSLKLRFAAISSIITSLMWTLVAILRH